MSDLLQIQNGKKVTISINATGLVTVFHGYGADRENLYDVAATLSSYHPNLCFIIPNGIQRFEGGGDNSYQWFSLRNYTQQAMQRGLADVSTKIAVWVKARLSELNLTQDQLYLTGFSQGAMLSLYLCAAGLLSPKKIVAFSGLFVPPAEINPSNKNTKILAIHGDRDQVLPMHITEASYNLLPSSGLRNFKYIAEKGVEHYITPNALKLAAEFLF